LEYAAEEKEDNMDFVYLCKDIEYLEERIMKQREKIQQVRLEFEEEEENPADRLGKIIKGMKQIGEHCKEDASMKNRKGNLQESKNPEDIKNKE
jgi:hypothetical protein